MSHRLIRLVLTTVLVSGSAAPFVAHAAPAAGSAPRRVEVVPALLAGTGIGFAGALLGQLTHPLLDFVSVPMGAAAGVTLFSNVGFGWEVLGSYGGFVVAAPISIGTRKLVGVPVGTGQRFGAVNVGLGLANSALCAGGSVLMAWWMSDDEASATALRVTPVLGRGGLPGLVVGGTW